DLRPQRRLAAGESQASQSEGRELRNHTRDLFVSQDVRFRQPREPGDWHAVLASEIAAICHRDAQIFDLSAEAVAQRLDHGPMAPSGCVGSTQWRPPSL